jgi:FkbM family methyltransferase
MADEILKRQFKAALVGVAQDNQRNLINKKNLIMNSIRHPFRMGELSWRVLNNRMRHQSSRQKITTFWEDEMTVVIPEEVSLKLFAYGYFEPGLTKIMLEYLKKNDTLIDIGAHYGYFSLLGSRIVGEKGNVHSFEPIPATYDILKVNTTKKSNIKINNIALFSKNGKMQMMNLPPEKSAYNSLITDGGGSDSGDFVSVETLCLDDYTRSNSIRPDFIKLDAENAEFQVLTGAKSTLEKCTPTLSLEVGGSSSKKCIDFLKETGYNAYSCRKGKLIIHDPMDKYSYDNLLFMPR